MTRKRPEELRNHRWYGPLLVSVTVPLLLAGWIDGAAAQRLWPTPGASHICTDAPLSITFSQAPQLGTSGTISLFDSKGVLVDRIDLADPNSSKKPIGGAVSDNGTLHLFNYYPVLINGDTAYISFHGPLAYGQTYYVLMDEGVLSAPGFSGITDPMVWTFATRSQPPAPKKRRLVVSADNRGDFCSVQGAIDFVPAGNATPFAIDVKPGTYNEIVYVPPTKPFVTVSGLDRDRTIIQYANNDNFNVAPVQNGPAPSDNYCIQRRIPGTPDLWNCWRALFGVEASDFTIRNITLHNTTPYGGSQAEAFRGNNDRILLDRVNLLSFQDTLRIQTSGFIDSSYIEGDVDFTWGTGAAFFWLDELKSMHAGYVSQVRNPPYPGSGSPPPNHGNVYLADRLTRAVGVPDASTYLSRIEPLRFPYSEAVFIDTAMDAHIIPVGWQLNPAGTTCAQAPSINFAEYHSTDLNGNPIDVSQRLPCSRQLSPDEAAFYSDPANILKGWVPNTVNAVPAGTYPGPTPGPVSPGAAITVNWSAPAGHSATDVITLYRAGTPDGFPLRRESIASAATLGSLDFTLPTFPGRYQFRYLPSGDARHSAVSNVIVAAEPCGSDGDHDEAPTNTSSESCATR